MTHNPHFSIVIPVYNREREIRRALDSCLNQDFHDYEIIVVDDASTDRSLGVMREYENQGVIVVAREVNGGEWPARNAGLAVARGDWIVPFDSDDALLPDALTRIYEYTAHASDDVERIGFMLRYVDGRVSPFPPPSGAVLLYGDFIGWLENTQIHDVLTVTRRRAFLPVPWPAATASGILYHLDFAKRYGTRWVPAIAAIVHTDAANRLSLTYGEEAARQVRRARDELEEIRLIIAKHGSILERLGPGAYRSLLRRRTVCFILAGERWNAVKSGARQLWSYPRAGLQWAAFLSALFGVRATRFALAMKWNLLERKRKRICREWAKKL